MEFRIEKKDAIRVLGVSAPLSADAEKAFEEAEALWVKVLTEGAELNAYGHGALCAELNKACDTKNPEPYAFSAYKFAGAKGMNT